MSLRHARSPILLAVLLLCAGLTLLPACDSTTDPEPQRHEIVPLTLVVPDTIAADDGWDLRTHVWVGNDLCWSLESAGLARDGDRLLVSGVSVQRRGPAVCPQMVAFEWVDLAGPALAAGEYVVEAGGLTAPVVVRGGAGSGRLRLCSFGRTYSYQGAWFFMSPTFVPYEVANPELIPGAGYVRACGVVDSLYAESIVLTEMVFDSTGARY